MAHQLSKSTFMRGIKCEKNLYLNKHHKELRDDLSEQQQAIFTQGSNVGELAQQLFPGGIDLTPESFYDFGKSIIKTKQAIAKGEPVIYEAAFLHNGVLAAMDIMVKSENGYKAFEVKSSTQVHEQYIQDVALQSYVILNCGVNLEDVSVVHINNEYVKQDELDIEQLFNIVSIWEEIQNPLAAIPNQVAHFKSILNSGEIPEVGIGKHCNAPYTCDFMGHCWKDIPVYSVFNISRLNADKCFELFERGVVNVSDVPDDFDLSENQRLQVEAEKNQTEFIDKEKIKEFLDELNYPLYHLDFETMGHAVPIFDGSRPYQQIVFQYSLHVQDAPNAESDHFEYLGETNGEDPRLKFVDQLIKDVGTKGDILVYNIGFERGKLEDLAELHPSKSAEINAIIDRLKDLMTPFQKKWYYTYKLKGSYSIKKVLPALVPEFDEGYSSLVISDGGTASLVYAQMTEGSYEGDYEAARKDLLAYCELDTLAMVKILEKLYECVSN
jgi:hypothetical protein